MSLLESPRNTCEFAQKADGLSRIAKLYSKLSTSVESGGRVLSYVFHTGSADAEAVYLATPTGATILEIHVDHPEYSFSGGLRDLYENWQELESALGKTLRRVHTKIMRPSAPNKYNRFVDLTRQDLASLEDCLIEGFAELAGPLIQAGTQAYYKLIDNLKEDSIETYRALLRAKQGFAARNKLPEQTLMDLVSYSSGTKLAKKNKGKGRRTSWLKKLLAVVSAAIVPAASAIGGAHGWPDGKTAGEVASDLEVDTSAELGEKITDTGIDGSPILLKDYAVVVPTEPDNTKPVNISFYDSQGELKFTRQIDSALLAITNENMIYCSPQNDPPLILQSILTGLKTPLAAPCDGLVTTFDNKIITADAQSQPPVIVAYDTSGKFLAMARGYNIFDFSLMHWQSELLLFNKSARGTDLKSIDLGAAGGTTQVEDVSLPSGIGSIYPETAYLDSQGNLVFLADTTQGRSTLLKYSGNLAVQPTNLLGPPGPWNNGIVHAFKDGVSVFGSRQAGVSQGHAEVWDFLLQKQLLTIDSLRGINYLGKKNIIAILDEPSSDYASNSLRLFNLQPANSSVISLDVSGVAPLNDDTFLFVTNSGELYFVSGDGALKLADKTKANPADITKREIAINGKRVAWNSEGDVYFTDLESLVVLAGKAPPIKPPWIPFEPTIIYDGRPEVGSFDLSNRFVPGANPPSTSSYVFSGDVMPDVKNTPFYHPAFPRKIAPEFIRHQTGQCGAAVDYADFQFGDDTDITNNHKAFDRNFTFGPLATYYNEQTGKPIKTEVSIDGAQSFSAGSCVPVFHKRVNYPGFFVDEFYYYRAFNAGWGAMADGFQHEHDYQIAMVWVNTTTGKPFHFAVRYHAVPFVGDIWMQKDVQDASELTAYGEWRSGELRLSKHPWANGKGAVVGPKQKYPNINTMSMGRFIYPLESRLNNSDVDASGHLKTKEHHGILNRTSPPAQAPETMPEFNDPDNIRTQSLQTQFMSYFKLGSPAEMSFILNGKTSDKSNWVIPQSAIDGKVGYIVNSAPTEPKVQLVGTGNGVLDLDGYLVGIGGSNRLVNFSLAGIPIKTGETIEITPNWDAIENGGANALNYFMNVDGRPIAFQSAATISGSQFEAALNEAINKSKTPAAPPNHTTTQNAKPVALINQNLLQYVSLGAIVGGIALLGAGTWVWRQDRRAARVDCAPTHPAILLPPEPQTAGAEPATEFSREELLSRRERVIAAYNSGRITYELMVQQVTEIDAQLK